MNSKDKQKRITEYSNKFFWFLSFLFWVCGIVSIFNSFFPGLVCALMGVIINPKVIDDICGRLGGSAELAKREAAKVLTICFGVLIGCGFAMGLYLSFGHNVENYSFVIFETGSKVFIYVVYLFICYFFLSDVNKKKRYMGFGIFYTVCILISLLTQKVVYFKIEWIDNIVDELRKDEWIFIRDVCLNSIKEAILTYIIFDTAIELIDDKRETKESGTEVDCTDVSPEKECMVEKNEEKIELQLNDGKTNDCSRFYIVVHDNETGVCKEYEIELSRNK